MRLLPELSLCAIVKHPRILLGMDVGGSRVSEAAIMKSERCGRDRMATVTALEQLSSFWLVRLTTSFE